VKIKTVEYVGTIATPSQTRPGPLPQIAFSGRSNVGKSSLINVLLKRTRKSIARVSSTPGKTQAINFFEVNGEFYLVDLPGFGYAKVPKKTRDAWQGLIEGYLSSEDGPIGVVHLVDCRRPPTDLDLQMLEYLAGVGLPTLVVLTKMDKLKSKRAREVAIDTAARELGIDRDQLVPFSSLTGEGRDALVGALGELLRDAPG
jgi:GTP-binding protein